MIEAHELTKRYGGTTAVDCLSDTIAPGTVTGFLGPNGAGRCTTMRVIMGLDRPTSGTVTVKGKPYRQHRVPPREVGALLEARAVHPGRSARAHPARHGRHPPHHGLQGQRGHRDDRPWATPGRRPGGRRRPEPMVHLNVAPPWPSSYHRPMSLLLHA